ncbi:MAG: hypothetical protein K8S56_04820 [Candidatus Cloacimonetes bacterium]|nr:hypothetical protein [Candidatus Cloacimonadota bacterium]
MKVLINGKEFSIEQNATAPLHTILEKLGDLIDGKSVVTSVSISGKALEGNWFNSTDKIYVMPDDLLELTTESAVALGLRVFQNTKEDFLMILKELGNCAEMFRVENEADANATFARSITNLRTFFDILQQSHHLQGIKVEELTIEDVSAEIFMSDFGKKLSDLIDIQQNKDWIMLADVIEYEMLPMLKKVETLFN